MAALGTLAVLASGACADESPAASTGAPTIVVTTSVWGDIVADAFGDLATIEVIIPAGADAHDFAPSARQAELMENADLVVANGLGLEAGMSEVLAAVAAAGTPVVALADAVAPSDRGRDDPHIWFDPTLVIRAIEALGDELVATTSLDRSTVDAAVAASAARLSELDGEIESTLASIPPERRLLVTNHDAFGRFAERYGFEVVGAVIPANSTSAEASAAGLVELADLIRELGVPAIFAETTESDQLARALADEAGGPIAVVELYTETLGEPGSGADTYAGLMRTDAERIAAALTAS